MRGHWSQCSGGVIKLNNKMTNVCKGKPIFSCTFDVPVKQSLKHGIGSKMGPEIIQGQ